MEPTTTKSILIMDERERSVYRHQNEFLNINFIIKQITTADYVVMSPTNNILAVIERKSLEDYAASLKDGRHSNKNKLVAMRRDTGCRIIYIVEGPDAHPGDYFGNIAFKNIESSIFHLMIEDGICVIRTKCTLDTAKTLARVMVSMDTLFERAGNVITGGEDMNETKEMSTLAAIDAIPREMIDQMKLLTVVHTPSDHELVISLWSCFPGIAATTADDYINMWSLADIVCDRVGDISKQRLKSGRKMSAKIVKSLTNIDENMQIRLLAAVPGISRDSAREMIKTHTLRAMLGWGIGGLGMVVIGKNSRRLGDKTAEKVLRLFEYTRKVVEVVKPLEVGNKLV
jgi:ERCC4-type nuclease